MKNVITNNWFKGSIASCILLFALLLVSKGNAVAADYVSLKMYPQHVGVFTVDGKQQFVAFGVTASGSTVNITSDVAWSSSNKNIVTIDKNGLATIVGSVTSGQVKITCSYPKKTVALAGVGHLLLRAPDIYSVGGTMAGFAGGTNAVLQNNAGDDLSVGSNGAFKFATELYKGDAYSVTVKTNPTSPNQTCGVSNSTGTIESANVTNVGVTCVTEKYSIGGTVSGLAAGNDVVLQNNAGDNHTVSANGGFTFPASIDDGSSYAVTVLTDPTVPNQTCVVTGGGVADDGSGTLAGANVTDVDVTCTTIKYAVGGSVAGLPGGESVTLLNNGTESVVVLIDGNFVFPTSLDDGTSYIVTVSAQPAGAICAFSGGSDTGDIAGADADVTVVCGAP